ncbi:MAG: HAMP domain-containing sensor histidine kinase [Eubacteriales bacterium]|nr:HAMP domain-containing sensor histidine kinase [Eubacteriales bacterium]
MKLSKKTFCYSIFISLVLVIFVLLYFSFMLPSLYVEHTANEYLDSVVKVQEGYSKNRSYQGLEVKNPTGSASIEIPFEGNRIYVAGKAFRITVEIKDQEILKIINKLRSMVKNAETLVDIAEDTDFNLPEEDIEKIKDRLLRTDSSPLSQILTFTIVTDEEMEGIETRKGKVHRITDSMMVFEGGMNDGDNDYTTYIAAGKTEDAVIFSFLPVMTPQMKEIRPIVFSSLPMITAVVFLLVLIASQAFSRKIVNPVIRLADYAENVKHAGYTEMEPLEITEKDEIGELGIILNELYERLRSQYLELEEKNNALARENKRQEVFLRASSHQLKTPITAALLLTEGMQSEIGKYKDTKKYLPEVKRQLLSMRKIVEDILYLNHSADHIRKEAFDINLLVKEVLDTYRISAGEKGLSIDYKERSIQIVNDPDIMRKILDNLISNAVSYTEEGGRITIRLSAISLEVYNSVSHIDEELLPHIYDPFVSSDTRQKGRGLGLYVTSYYTELLGLGVEITNLKDGVLARLSLK